MIHFLAAPLPGAASQFGYTDTGLTGLNTFLKRHTCNHLCVAQQPSCPPLNPLPLPRSPRPPGGKTAQGAWVTLISFSQVECSFGRGTNLSFESGPSIVRFVLIVSPVIRSITQKNWQNQFL